MWGVPFQSSDSTCHYRRAWLRKAGNRSLQRAPFQSHLRLPLQRRFLGPAPRPPAATVPRCTSSTATSSSLAYCTPLTRLSPAVPSPQPPLHRLRHRRRREFWCCCTPPPLLLSCCAAGDPSNFFLRVTGPTLTLQREGRQGQQCGASARASEATIVEIYKSTAAPRCLMNQQRLNSGGFMQSRPQRVERSLLRSSSSTTAVCG